MSIREKLKGYIAAKREVLELRARALRAQREARYSHLPEDEERARSEAARYEAKAEILEEELLRIEASVDGLADPDARRAIRMRFLDGRPVQSVAQALHYSGRQVRRLIEKAVSEIDRAEE